MAQRSAMSQRYSKTVPFHQLFLGELRAGLIPLLFAIKGGLKSNNQPTIPTCPQPFCLGGSGDSRSGVVTAGLARTEPSPPVGSADRPRDPCATGVGQPGPTAPGTALPHSPAIRVAGNVALFCISHDRNTRSPSPTGATSS